VLLGVRSARSAPHGIRASSNRCRTARAWCVGKQRLKWPPQADAGVALKARPGGFILMRYTETLSEFEAQEVRCCWRSCTVPCVLKRNQSTFLHTQAGEPRSAKSLGNDFRAWCDKAGLPAHCAMHGLRKGCLRILAEAGCNILELQSRSGHLTLSELQKYIDKADKRFAADRASEKVIAHKARAKNREENRSVNV
jgi:Phage integrase family